MRSFILCAAALALVASPIQAQRTVHGIVFNDANGNGVMDPGERPVPGVVVSNQRDVVTTDAAGRYRLAADENSIVFISVPTDWQSVGAFYRVANADSISFGLRAARQPRSFKFIHASDTHIDTAHLDRVRRFKALADSINPAFTLIAGDLIYDSMSQQEPRARGFFELFLAEMKSFGGPYWTVPGNHDHFGIIQSRSHVPETHPLYNRGMYRLYFGPEYYSFNYGGVHFIGFDTVQPDDSAYYGGVDSLQLAWLKKDVAAIPASMPIVTFSHIPFASGLESMTGYLEMALVASVAHPKSGPTFRHMGANTLETLDAFKGHPLPLILGGHMHVAEKLAFQTDRGPLRFETSAAIVGPNDYGPVVMPSGFSLYAVKNGVVDAGTFVPLTMPNR
ncbi:MAG TPA: metallophosphoesterase [Gemmatimonadaceae bacterium]|nr:metallophosphoesterase [Gemmatimonadaceae bacterium]